MLPKYLRSICTASWYLVLTLSLVWHLYPGFGVLLAVHPDSSTSKKDDRASRCIQFSDVQELRAVTRTRFLWVVLFVTDDGDERLFEDLEALRVHFDETVQVGWLHCQSNRRACVDVPNTSSFFRAYNFRPTSWVLTPEEAKHLISSVENAFPLPNLPFVSKDFELEALTLSNSSPRRLFAVLSQKEMSDVSIMRKFRAACHAFSLDVDCYGVRTKDLAHVSTLHVTKPGLTLVSYPQHLNMETYTVIHHKKAIAKLQFFDFVKWLFSEGSVQLSFGYAMMMEEEGDALDGHAWIEDDYDDLLAEGTREKERWLQILQARERGNKNSETIVARDESPGKVVK